MTQPITINRHWQHKKTAAEVIVTRINFRNGINYIAVDKNFSSTLPQWMFLQDVKPVPERKKKAR
jgi:hypothetical protein